MTQISSRSGSDPLGSCIPAGQRSRTRTGADILARDLAHRRTSGLPAVRHQKWPSADQRGPGTLPWREHDAPPPPRPNAAACRALRTPRDPAPGTQGAQKWPNVERRDTGTSLAHAGEQQHHPAPNRYPQHRGRRPAHMVSRPNTVQLRSQRCSLVACRVLGGGSLRLRDVCLIWSRWGCSRGCSRRSWSMR